MKKVISVLNISVLAAAAVFFAAVSFSGTAMAKNHYGLHNVRHPSYVWHDNHHYEPHHGRRYVPRTENREKRRVKNDFRKNGGEQPGPMNRRPQEIRHFAVNL